MFWTRKKASIVIAPTAKFVGDVAITSALKVVHTEISKRIRDFAAEHLSRKILSWKFYDAVITVVPTVIMWVAARWLPLPKSVEVHRETVLNCCRMAVIGQVSGWMETSVPSILAPLIAVCAERVEKKALEASKTQESQSSSYTFQADKYYVVPARGGRLDDLLGPFEREDDAKEACNYMVHRMCKDMCVRRGYQLTVKNGAIYG